ncbi:MAG TPA: AIM24 family protein [Vicinamibacterales bacterium]|nr:AIM24 family protein [Vicinamibacterales bacterium]
MESACSVERFLRESLEKGTPGERFGKESERMLRIDVDGGVWLKPGAAIAYRGEIAFERLPTMGARSLEDVVLREMTPLVRAIGKGRLYCGHHGWHVRIVRLASETIFVAWDELLAFEESLQFQTTFVGHGLSVAAGGLVAVRLSGDGALAIALHGAPLSLPVTPDNPVSTDPHATLAWSGSLTPSLKTDLSWRSIFRHGGQEPVQMFFDGTGYVVVQPYEDARRVALRLDPKRLASIFTG